MRLVLIALASWALGGAAYLLGRWPGVILAGTVVMCIALLA